MSIVINIVLLTVAAIFVKYAYSQDHCPAPPDPNNLCNYTRGIRDCQHDVYMTLCTITNADDYATDAIWEFMCTNVNYCMGCRYCLTHCYTGEEDEAASHNCGDEQLFTLLGWYDGITMGGKFALCDMGNATVMQYVKGQHCLTENRAAIDDCNFAFQNAIWGGFNSSKSSNSLTCSEMDSHFKCFMDILDMNCPSGVVDVFTNYFNGVLSMSPCRGGASGLIASVLIMILSMTLLAIANFG